MTVSTTSKRNLFALCIGIDAYEHVGRLSGAVHDATSMSDYLDEPCVQEVFSVHKKHLFNEGATKSAIVEAIQTHLGQASEGDVALLFFAGHGHREDTTVPAFQRAEIDGKICNLVCVDSKASGGSPQNTCLADKELRHLIHQLSQSGAQVITIFDCCHSGDNTRSAMGSSERRNGVRKVELDAADPRPWEGFIFHDKINPDDLESLGLHEVLPEGKHIQLAACRDVELAWEENGIGAFTGALLETLQSHDGCIRYHDLYSRIKNRIHRRGEKEQTPQIYVQTGNAADRNRLFLTHEMVGYSATTSVTYNKAQNEWRMDLGALQGIPADPATGSAVVRLFSLQNPAKKRETSVATVFPGYSVIRPTEPPLDPQGVYRAQVSGLAIRPLSVFLKGDGDVLAFAREGLASRIENSAVPFLTFSEQEDDSDYVLEARDDSLLVTLVGDSQELLKSVACRENGMLVPEKLDIVYGDFTHMARWTFLRDLEHNPPFPGTPRSPGPGKRPVELRIIQLVFQDGEEVEVTRDLSKGSLTLDPTHDSQTNQPFHQSSTQGDARIRFELINHSDEELYCSLVYLSREFGVDFPFFPSADCCLLPGQAIQSKAFGSGRYKDYVPVRAPDFVIQAGWEGASDYLKLIVSKTKFEVETLKMDELPTPNSSTGSTRGMMSLRKSPELPRTYWSTQTVEVFVVNPHVKPVKEAGPPSS